MDLVVDLIGWVLQSLQEGVQQGQESVDGGEAWDGGVSREVDHGLLDVLVCDVLSGGLIILLLIEKSEFFSDGGTDGVAAVLAAFDATQ